MFVSESKFLSSPSAFIPHILNPHPESLLGLITKPAVEAALLVRLANKARLYGQDLDAMGNPIDMEGREGKIVVDEVVKLYEKWVIPLTKVVEVSPSSCSCASVGSGRSVKLTESGDGCRPRYMLAGRLPAYASGRSLSGADGLMDGRRSCILVSKSSSRLI